MSKTLSNQKGFIHLLMILILLISIPIGVYLVSHPAIFKPFARENKDTLLQNNEDKYGYIIELKEDPVVSQKRVNPSKPSDQIKNELRSTREEAKKDIFKRLGFEYPVNIGRASKSSIESSNNLIPSNESFDNLIPQVLSEYENVFNGFAMKISKKQADKVKKSQYVKQVYPNLEVKINLNQSVPLIGADKVWSLGDLNNQAITGKGVKVAVIDTGVDFTHPDLGRSNITERSLEKINSDTYPLPSLSAIYNHLLSFDDDRLVYPSGNKIILYDFKLKSYEAINLTSVNFGVTSLALKGDIIVYFGLDLTSQGVFIYDLKAKTNKQILDSHSIGAPLSISNGKVVFGAMDNSFQNKIYIYDIASGTSITIAKPQDVMYSPLVYGNKVVYRTSSTYGASQTFLYNLDTKETSEILGLKQGQILAFNGSKILYTDTSIENSLTSFSKKILYDIDSGESIELNYQPETLNSLSNDLVKISTSNWATVYESIDRGQIGNGVVFFDKSIKEDKTIIGYDLKLKRYVQINLLKGAVSIAGSENKLCFISTDSNIYCHQYDSNLAYPLPEKLYNDKVISGYNFITKSNNAMDDQGHGTHVAATIAGNGVLKGVAPDAKIVAYKALDSYGSGSFANIIAAVDMAVSTRLDSDTSNDIDIISMSLGAVCGSYSVNCGPDDPQSKAIDKAVDAGIVAVIAAGNSGPSLSTINSPGTARKGLTVGAVDKSKKIASFSSRGPVKIGFETVNKPDILAPGVNICAAEWGNFVSSSRCIDDNHISISGTSMATPHIAGVAALVKQYHPDWTGVRIKNEIMGFADNLGYDANTQGYGFVNVPAMFKNATPLPSPKVGIDNDGDGFLNTIEQAIGTDPNKFCPSSNSDNAWPADINNDGKVDGQDLSKLSPIINGIQGFDKRYDLNNDGKVDLADSKLVTRLLGHACDKPIAIIIPQDIIDVNLNMGGSVKAFDLMATLVKDFRVMTVSPNLQSNIFINYSLTQQTPDYNAYAVTFITNDTSKVGSYQGNVAVTYSTDQKLNIPVKVTIYPQSGAPSVKIKSPNGGESLTIGSIQKISWDAIGLESCTLYYETDQGISYSIADNLDPKIGYYNWSVAINPTALGQKVKAKITCKVTNLPSISDSSDDFIIVSP